MTRPAARKTHRTPPRVDGQRACDQLALLLDRPRVVLNDKPAPLERAAKRKPKP